MSTPSTGTQSRSFFLRAFSITITTAQGAFTITNAQYESLRVVFTIEQYIFPLKDYWTSSVTIYNLSESTLSAITQGSVSLSNPFAFRTPLQMGSTVSISGGYQYGSSGAFSASANVLSTGRLFQSIVTKENVVDYKLTLRCISALAEDILSNTNLSIGKNTSDLQTINQVIAGSANPFDFAPGSPDAASLAALKSVVHPGAQTFRDKPLSIVSDITRQHPGIHSWISTSPEGLNLLNMRTFGPSDFQQPPAYAYAPPNLTGQKYAPGIKVKQTVLGVPEQTQDGVTFRVLLDSVPKVGDLVQLALGTVIQATPLQYGGNQTPPIPSQSGVYIIGGLKHYGDIRGKGDDWYTEILGLSQDYFNNWTKARTPGAVLGNIGNNLIGLP